MNGPDASDTELLGRAHRALDRRHDSPADAGRDAADVLAADERQSAASVVALHALGLTQRELGELAAAEAHLRDAIELAEHLDRPAEGGAAGSGLVGVLIARGSIDDALLLAEQIRPGLDTFGAAELDFKCALANQEMGRMEQAHALYTAALDIIADGPDPLLETRLRANRGTVLAYLGRDDDADTELDTAERLAEGSGHLLLAGGIAQNRGFALARSGRVVDALRAFDRSDAAYRQAGYPGRYAGQLAADRGEALMIAGLDADALDHARNAVRLLAEHADVIDLAEARLLLARAFLANGDSAAAKHTALAATDDFDRAGRPPWALLARYVALAAEVATDEDLDAFGLADRASDLAKRLEAAGWPTDAASARVLAARQLLEAGALDQATELLRLTALDRTRGAPGRRAHAWLAQALLLVEQGDIEGARDAASTGLDVIIDHQLEHSSTDLRLGASRHGAELADLGLRLALDERRPDEVLRWGERLRANALVRTAGAASLDPALTSALRELHDAESALRSAIESGGPVDRAREHVDGKEAAVSNAARTARGRGHEQRRELDLDRLGDRLGPATLVEFVQTADRLAAIVLDHRGPRLCDLDGDVSADLDHTQFALERLASERVSPAASAAAHAGLTDALGSLDQRLLAPLGLDAGGDVVIVPTGALHAVPWQGLPSLAPRSVTVTPSARHWQQRSGRDHTAGRTAVVAGPDLVHAHAEARAVAAHYDDVLELSPDLATVDAALAAINDASCAHLICHGHLRPDSPMFSSLRFTGGALTLYDLQQLQSVPALVVLPACHAGAVRALTGNEILGTAAALIGLGVGCVIAPLTAVNDHASVSVMERLHAWLREGERPAAALSRLRQSADMDHRTLACAMSLTCFE